MKKIIFALAIFSICIACTKDKNANNSGDVLLQEINLSVTPFDGIDDTKSAVVIDSTGTPKTPVGNFIWTSGDKIGIYPLLSDVSTQNSQQIIFKVSAGDDASSAQFTGTGWGLITNNTISYFSYYPYDDMVTHDVATVTYQDNLNQTANKSTAHLGINDFLYAPAIRPVDEESATFNFYHIGALIEFEITVPDSVANRKITKLEVSADTPVFMVSGKYSPSTTVVRDPSKSIYGPAITDQTLTPRMKLQFNACKGVLPENKKIHAYFLAGPAAVAGTDLKVRVWDEFAYSYETIKTPSTNINSQEFKIYKCEVKENKSKPIIDLSKDSSGNLATANCYIVQDGGRYKFLATVKGNGIDPYDDTPEVYENAVIDTTGCKPIVLWESQNDIQPLLNGCLIDNETITLDKDGYIVFEATNKLGNAAISLQKDGVIVWTWHIWLTGELENYTTVHGGITFFDRDLGSISTSKTLKDRGLFYQWGKPWPYLPYYSDNKTRCISTNNSIWSSHGVTSTNTLENVIQHPTEYCYSVTGHTCWCWDVPSKRIFWQTTQKTMYDPCPIGWKVPDKAAFGCEDFTNPSRKKTETYFMAFYDDNGNAIIIVKTGLIGTYLSGYEDTFSQYSQGWMWATDAFGCSMFTSSSGSWQSGCNYGCCIRPIAE